MPLYIKRYEISPLYNGEVNASVYEETEISPLYNGEVNALYIKRLKSRRCTAVYEETSDIKRLSPLYNGEVNASVYKETEISPLYNETEISPLYNGEVNSSVYKETECLCI